MADTAAFVILCKDSPFLILFHFSLLRSTKLLKD